MEILVALGPYVLPILASILTLLLAAGAKKLFEKWGVERSDKVDAMIDKYVGIGVNFAEVAGTKYLETQGMKMSGGSKKAKAIKVVMDELKQSGVTDVAEDLVSARIESWLLDDGHEPGVPTDPEEDGENA
jgi:hypothetical protein